MENLRTWTPLHNEISNCHQDAQAIVDVLHKNGHKDATLEKVKAIIGKHFVPEGWVGPSLPTLIVWEFNPASKKVGIFPLRTMESFLKEHQEAIANNWAIRC